MSVLQTTGKTYIGVQLSRIIHRATSEIMLCVCYTNHALDSFLEDLEAAGITEIVRIGGRRRSPHSLRTLTWTALVSVLADPHCWLALPSKLVRIARCHPTPCSVAMSTI